MLQSCKTVLNFCLINFKARILRFWSKSHHSSLWSFRSRVESQKNKEISKILSAASIPSLLLYHWALFACCSFKPSLVCLFVDGSPVSLMALGGLLGGSHKAFLRVEQSSHFWQTSCRTCKITLHLNAILFSSHKKLFSHKKLLAIKSNGLKKFTQP